MPRNTGVITPEDLVECAARELQIMRDYFPDLVRSVTMTQNEAEFQIACMALIHAKLEGFAVGARFWGSPEVGV